MERGKSSASGSGVLLGRWEHADSEAAGQIPSICIFSQENCSHNKSEAPGITMQKHIRTGNYVDMRLWNRGVMQL